MLLFLLSSLLSSASGASLKEKLGLTEDSQVFSAYVTDWAHYRTGAYKWSASDYAAIAPRTNIALFSFIYFCPPAGTSPMPYWAVAPYGSCTDATEFQLMSVDPSDASGISTIAAMGPKVVLSVGGWNFPSSYFSKMASSAASRGKFVASVKAWMAKYGAAGVDIDWEYPCSPARSNPVKISCAKFQTVEDVGGSCPQDTANLLALAKDLRAGLGDAAIISIASQANKKLSDEMDLVAVSQYIDTWHVMTYDYAVSDITSQATTSPNCPLYIPTAGVQMSVNQTITHYLSVGVPKNKIMVGLPLYAHSFFVPGLQANAWQKFGLPAKVQGECCGPFKSTYGAKPGQGCQLCGSMMWSEIVAAKPMTYYDNVTQSVIGYFPSNGADGGYTEAGTWLSYNDITSAQAVVAYEQQKGLAGVFIYSADMDTKDYQMMNAIADALGKGPGPGPSPPSPPSPSPGGTPSCTTAGQAALCKVACASHCRGFPPGFASPGCVDDTDCTNPPSWAAHSVCTC